MTTYLIVQAQSIGLWGDIFAAGCIIFNAEQQLEEHFFSCPPDRAQGFPEDRKWVEQNVIAQLPKTHLCYDPQEVCERIWDVWIRAKKNFTSIYCASYLGFPISMNLFASAIMRNFSHREEQAPYPFLEIDTAFLLTNYEIGVLTHLRKPDEIKYHPLEDAKYYGRLFQAACHHIKTKGTSYKTLMSRPLCGLDAKSRGLWGGIFYFGSVLLNSENNEEKGTWRCWRDPRDVEGDSKDDIWRQPYINELPKGIDCKDGKVMGEEVWKWIRFAQKTNALFISWCPFPVDYRALAEAIKSDPEHRQLKAPYPIHDAATALHLNNLNPVGTYPRKESEEKHGDPRGSARLAIRLFLGKLA